MTSSTMNLEERLERIERLLLGLLARQQPRQWYSVEEFARLVERSEFTCREWCRSKRIAAEKKSGGRGAHAAWAISHAEYERFQRDGLRQPVNSPRAASSDTGVSHE